MRYEKTFEIRWSDLDPNRHLRHTAFADLATHVRFRFLAEHGFPPSRFQELDFGPVILREETRYLREVGLEDEVTIDFRVAALAADGSRFVLSQSVRRSDGVEAARHTVEGGWLGLASRRLRPPPEEILALLRLLERTEDFRELKPIGR